jgi:hypothetical protein
MRENGKPWDKEAVYDAEIAPLMTKIIAICKEHEIPVVACFQYGDFEEGGAGHCVTALVKESRGDSLHIRRIAIAAEPERAFALAETRVTDADGKTTTSIRRVG